MDDVSQANLEALVRDGERVIAENKAALTELSSLSRKIVWQTRIAQGHRVTCNTKCSAG